MRAGKGVLFATAHLGNWELSAFAHALMAAPMNVVVRPLDNPRIDAMVERRRSLSGNRPIGKKDFARSILKALGANQAVGILIDQNESLESGVFVDFFGMKACASPGLARFAAHSGAAVIPGFALWNDGGTALRAALLPAGRGDRRCRGRYPGAAHGSGGRDPRAPRPMAVDSSALEDAASRRATLVLKGTPAAPVFPMPC